MTLGVCSARFFGAMVLLAIAILGSAQEPARVSFDVASIRSSGKMKDTPVMSATTAGINYSNVTLRACIATAYEVQEYRVSGPAWLESERYDISAKTEEQASTQRLHQMLQSLLADRFKVSLHRDKKDLPVLALVVGKHGSKLQPATNDGPAGSEASGIKFDFKAGLMIVQRTSLESFAQYLSRFPTVGRPVVDRTELKGLYDFSLKLVDDSVEQVDERTRAANMKRALSDETVIFGQIESLGLKLEPQHAPVEVLVVDHAEKVPTDN